MNTSTRQLLERVAMRQRIAAAAGSALIAFWVLTGVYVAVLVAGRLLGLFPDLLPIWSAGLIPVLAGLAGVLLHRRPREVETAHLADARAGTGDLFLTVLLSDASAGAFSPLVESQAESRSREVSARAVVPFAWQRRAQACAAALAVLVLCTAFVPQLDPFGREKERRQLAEQRRTIENVRKSIAMRKAMLQKKQAKTANSPDVAEALNALTSDFRKARRDTPKANLRRLSDRQQALGKLWKQVKEESLRQNFDRAAAQQRFGAKGTKFSEWQQQLEQGKTDALKKELDALKQLAEKLDRTTNEAERQRLERELAQRMKDVANFAMHGLNNKAAADAMNQALQQLALTKADELTKEALNALQEGLDLAGMEFENLAQAMRDMDALQKALKAAQMAKMLNQMDQLDGEACAQCNGIGDYIALYEKMLGSRGGTGPGMGGPGTGQGNIAREDDSQETDYKAERSRSEMTAGKMLMQWKVKELALPGQAREEYQASLRKVKQGVNEAITREEVPPGYHDAVKQYFSTIGEGETEDAAN